MVRCYIVASRWTRYLSTIRGVDKICKCGGLETVLEAMESAQSASHLGEGERAGVLEQGCRVLRNIAQNHCPAQTEIARLAGVGRIASAMDQHSEHAGLQAQACGALAILSVAANRAKFLSVPATWQGEADEGVLARIVRAMSQHTQDSGVQECGCCALRNIAFFEQRLIREAGGVERIAHAIELKGATFETISYGRECLDMLESWDEAGASQAKPAACMPGLFSK